MKSTREIYKNNPSFLQEPAVTELLEYCKEQGPGKRADGT